MKLRLLILVCSLIGLSSCVLSAREKMPTPKPLRLDDPKGLELPPGVPRLIDTNGNVISIDHGFTTPQYQYAAAQLLLEEANRVAEEMRLPDEVLPITETNVTELHAYSFGFSYVRKSMGGVVCTSNYVYLVGRGNKFSGLVVAGYDQVCLKHAKSSVPLMQMDTNAAYQLATQWLATVSVDVNGLNRDCKAHVAVSSDWNGLAKLGQVPRKDFTPIYYVWWTTPKNDAEGFGGPVDVELFLPTKKLLQMHVDDPKYVLRKPLAFTNLASLFPGTGQITILTDDGFTVLTNKPPPVGSHHSIKP
jgi:hypothetical protein